jgi:hypothetical protein
MPGGTIRLPLRGGALAFFATLFRAASALAGFPEYAMPGGQMPSRSFLPGRAARHVFLCGGGIGLLCDVGCFAEPDAFPEYLAGPGGKIGETFLAEAFIAERAVFLLHSLLRSSIGLQGYLAHKKLPPPPRTTVGP